MRKSILSLLNAAAPASWRGTLSANCPLPKLGYWLFVANKTSHRSLLYTIARIGFTSIAWLNLSELGATIEPQPQQIAQAAMPSEKQADQKILFVNPSVGSNGDGSESSPFKTITQALQVAEPNSVIILATGKYSAESGETFPLKLKPGVSIQGDPKTKGSNIAIAGGGTFISPTFARQDVTILGANSSSLTGVSVSNPNPRGYGLWIESSSPTVSENTFTGSNHDGISVTGNSSPIIRNNYFHHNGANGITIYGTSNPVVRENVFEQTGFGINIAQKAAPVLIANQIIKNRSGVVAQANSQPVLRNNLIEGNTEDGVVAIANSVADLGTSAQPGGNVFRQNARYDINGNAAKQLLSAVGNQLAQDRLIGNIDLAGTGNPIAIANQLPVNNQIALNPSTAPKATANNSIPNLNPATAKKPLANSQQNSTEAEEQNTPPDKIKLPVPPFPSEKLGVDVPPLAAVIEIPVPPPESIGEAKPKPSQKPQKLSSVKIAARDTNPSNIALAASNNEPVAAGSNTEIKIPPAPPASVPVAPPPPPKTGSLTQGLPALAPAPINASELLPPNSNIPNPPRQQEIAKNTVATDSRYRVVVEAETESQQEKVRSLFPGAFRTVSNGKAIVQAGIFSDRTKASEVLQLLNNNGLKAAIEQLN